MKRKNIKFYIFSLLIGLITASCLSDVDLINFSKDIKLDESLVFPIGDAKVTIKDILNKYGLPQNIDTTNTEISYVNSFSTEFKFDNLNFRDSIEPLEKIVFLSPIPLTFPPNYLVAIPPIDVDLTFNANAIGDQNRVDQLVVNSSLLNVQVDVSPDLVGILASSIKIQFEFSDADLHIENGIMPSIRPSNYGVIGQIPVGSFKVNLNGRKSIPFKINVYINPQSVPVFISPTSFIKLNVSFSNVNYKVAYGYFKMNYQVEKKYDIPVDLNSFFPNSHFKLANPTVDITATTNVGENLDVNIDYVRAYNSAYPDKVFNAMFYDPVSKTTSKSIFETLTGPTNLGDWTTKTYGQINSKNGETDKIFDNSPYPNTIEFKYTVTSNPLRIQNFITPKSQVKLDVHSRIPFSVKGGSYFNLTDTIHNLDIGTALDNVDSAVLVITVYNGLPVKANYRMTYWRSEQPNDTVPGIVNTIVDDSNTASLNSEFQINAPKVDGDGIVLPTVIMPQVLKIGLNKKNILQLKQTKFIVFKLYLEGSKTVTNGVTKEEPIHFTTKNSFAVKLGVFLKSNATVNIGITK